MQKFNFVLKSVYKNSLSFTFRFVYLSYTSIKRLGEEESGNKDKLKQKQKKLQYFVYGLGTMLKLRKVIIRLNKTCKDNTFLK